MSPLKGGSETERALPGMHSKMTEHLGANYTGRTVSQAESCLSLQPERLSWEGKCQEKLLLCRNINVQCGGRGLWETVKTQGLHPRERVEHPTEKARESTPALPTM